MCAPPRASVVSACFGVSVAASLAARRLEVLERVEVIAPAFPVEKHGEASLGLARRRLERRKNQASRPVSPYASGDSAPISPRIIRVTSHQNGGVCATTNER